MIFRTFSQRVRLLSVCAATAGLLLVCCGCSRSSETSQPVQEVRGAPIQGAGVASAPVSSSLGTSSPTTLKAPEASTVPVATVSSNAPGPATPTQAQTAGNASTISFDQLAGYTFEISDDLLGPVTNDLTAVEQKTNAQIPETVKAFNQKKVALRGFMLPLKVEGGLVTEMLIMKDQSMCCYGTTPRINDWVSVKMRNKGVRPMMDLPVTLHGTLRVGEMRENGYLVGIYSMDGEGMEAPEAPSN